ncbi:AbiV family abortive infection protein [Mesorhizobium shangrilense]|uniref:AbiV family abortive infection protein n=1 Tax=Mesorhizobium shangrilense TaxID=460060 RepID=A0ABV2DIB9_9HYPH
MATETVQMEPPAPDTADAMAPLNELVEEIAAGRVSVMEIMRSAPEGDYFAFVQQARLSRMLMADRRVLERLMVEMRGKMIEAGADPDNRDIDNELARKDGARRFPKLLSERADAINTQASLLTAKTFPERLEQYTGLIAYVEKLWADACELFHRGNFPMTAFMSILVIEEVGKLTRLADELIYLDAPLPIAGHPVVEKSHRRKHFMSVMSGALVNARLERILGKNTVRRVLHEAESDELEKTRQRCLYIDMAEGRAVTPTERIGEPRARELTILAGELMAEILGHFPWEFERMMVNVVAFERQLGLPEKKIERR